MDQFLSKKENYVSMKICKLGECKNFIYKVSAQRTPKTDARPQMPKDIHFILLVREHKQRC